MNIKKLLIANRGEIAIRIARAAASLGIPSVAIYTAEDASSLHTKISDQSIQLQGQGVSAYLDAQQIVQLAQDLSCDSIHPGYGFLSENADFAALCAQSGLIFVGPDVSTLQALGDKITARRLAAECGVPIVPGLSERVSLQQVEQFYNGLGDDASIIIKACAGGGGRGMRIVNSKQDIASAYRVCRAEALASFGNAELYVERCISPARHIEIQILGDGSQHPTHLWERECSLQRHNQKIMEIAPSPRLSTTLRHQLLEYSLRMAKRLNYKSLGTFEFLITDDESSCAFIEANPRLQVEHTVSEQITGVDIVQAQIQIAGGMSLADLHLEQADIPQPEGYAIELRINMESTTPEGNILPESGTLAYFDPPSGPTIRVDTFGYQGYSNSPFYDSLLAKLIIYARHKTYAQVVQLAYQALCEFRIEGVQTNKAFLQNLLQHPDVINHRVHTTFIGQHISSLALESLHPQRYFRSPHASTTTPNVASKHSTPAPIPPDSQPVSASMQGVLAQWLVNVNDEVYQGQTIAFIESMKMQLQVTAPFSGYIRALMKKTGEIIDKEEAILFIEPAEILSAQTLEQPSVDPDYIRPDLARLQQRIALLMDKQRPEAVAKRRKTAQRTARENVAALCDAGTFMEYGGLAIAAQKARRQVDDLIKNTPADGMITGLGKVNGELFVDSPGYCAILAYDYTVLAGTQGTMNHKKTDRILTTAEKHRLPVIFFTEGGGGRPGDTDNATKVAGLDTPSFLHYARLSGVVPRIAIVSGRCFAGNAAFAGCSDILIATENACIGMAGPAMIEGGGMGVFKPEDIGPIEVQRANGVVDCVVADEQQAAILAKKLLGYFQGTLTSWQCDDQRLLRHSIPENRLHAYDVRAAIELLADSDSVVELRPDFAPGMVTALIRLEGKPCGLLANDPRQRGGAIDANGADKAARFMQLCDAFGLPLVSLCDTPGFMVGPEEEKTATVRHVCRMYVTGASLRIPVFGIVLRKGYGLGAQAMMGGSFHHPFYNIAWPSGEFGGMGLEGAVNLAYRKELQAESDPHQRQQLFTRLVDELYEKGQAINMAAALEIDAVIDPAETRTWLVRGLQATSLERHSPLTNPTRTMIDTW